MRHHIKVTQEHIDWGTRGCPEWCPVAQALDQHFKSRSFVSPDGFRVGKTNYTSPESVYTFVKRFDNHLPVKPFGFYLEIK